MRRVRCYECGKGYDYDEDGFCPKCGSFNLPHKAAAIGVDGGVIRREGINERNHRGSFLHAELHEENRERRGTVLEQDMDRMSQKTTRKSGAERQKRLSVMVAVIFAIVIFNIFSSILSLFL